MFDPYCCAVIREIKVVKKTGSENAGARGDWNDPGPQDIGAHFSRPSEGQLNHLVGMLDIGGSIIYNGGRFPEEGWQWISACLSLRKKVKYSLFRLVFEYKVFYSA